MSEESRPLSQIRDVIDRNIRTATLDDLKRGGRQKFKVMKMAQFYSLVDRAVNNVIQTQALHLAEEERHRLVVESNREFKRLLGERQQELRDLHRKDEEILEARREVKKLETDARAQTERIQLLEEEMRLDRERLELAEAARERSQQLDIHAAALESRLQAVENELETERRRVQVANEDQDLIRDRHVQATERTRELEGDLARRIREFEKERIERETLESTLAEVRSRIDSDRDFEEELARERMAREREQARREQAERGLTDARERVAALEQELDEFRGRVQRLREDERGEHDRLEQALEEARRQAGTHREVEDRLSTLRAERDRECAVREEAETSLAAALDRMSEAENAYRDELRQLRAGETRRRVELEAERARRETLEQALAADREKLQALALSADDADRRRSEEILELRRDRERALSESERERALAEELTQRLEQGRERLHETMARLEDSKRVAEARDASLMGLEERHDRARQELETTRERVRERDETERALLGRLAKNEVRSRELQEEIARLVRERGELEEVVQGRGELSDEIRRLREELAKRDEQLARARERSSLLQERIAAIEAERTEAREAAGRYRTKAESAHGALEERESTIRDMRTEIERLTVVRDQEEHQESAVRADIARLAEEIHSERERRREDRDRILAETRRQQGLVEEMATLRARLEDRLGANGEAIEDIHSRVAEVAPLLDEVRNIRRTLAEGGGPGAMADAERLMASIQGTVAAGIDRIQEDLGDRIEGMKKKETARQVARSVEAAQVALDRLFTEDVEIESNLQVVDVRSANTGGIGGSLEKIRRLRGAALGRDARGVEDQ